MDRQDVPATNGPPGIDLRSPEAYLNRDLSWLAFARRVLALVEDEHLPLLERVRFAGIMGMLHDEYFLKRASGLKRAIQKGSRKPSPDGKLAEEQLAACRLQILEQSKILEGVVCEQILPALAREGLPIRKHDDLEPAQQEALRQYFQDSVLPILTPLGVDAEHPFPFISGGGLNLAVVFGDGAKGRERFVRIKVPSNRPRWVPIPGGVGTVPLEQLIAANLDLLLPSASRKVCLFRVTRGAEGEVAPTEDFSEADGLEVPGSIILQVGAELKARRFAGVVRLEIDPDMPRKLVKWLTTQLGIEPADVYVHESFLGLRDLSSIDAAGRDDLQYPSLQPATHPRLEDIDPRDPGAIFDVLAEGDILLHHPYDSFDTSVVQLLEAAAVDPEVLAIKLTIYRTSSDSPIVRALVDAARRGKQVAVLVEVTARFDEAPNMAWGQLLEREGAHVAYGVERLKTHVKLALVVREERGQVRRYLHFGTGNYHTGTARLYEDLGVLTADPTLCAEAAALFNALTGATAYGQQTKMLVAPTNMRKRFVEMIQREAEHARAGRPSGIHAKMNQLQDQEMIRELYLAGQAGVPVLLNVRGLCCLRPGMPGLSENIRVYSVVGRFLEHSRIFEFINGGQPEYYIGSADWMRRNLNGRVETVVPVTSPDLCRQLADILRVYIEDNASAWDCQPNGTYTLRSPEPGQERLAAQEVFISS